MSLSWNLTTVKDERVWVSHPARFTVQFAGRMKEPHACCRLWDSQTKQSILGFKNEEHAKEVARGMYDEFRLFHVDLVACCGAKLKHKAPARELYQSDLFRKAFAYSTKTYWQTYILSAAYGLIHPDTVIEPYDQRLTDADINRWSWLVQKQIDKLQATNMLFHAHAGRDYVEPLISRIPMVFPMRGMGIGQQLAWYKKQEMK